MMNHRNFWSACEALVGPAAVEAEWRILAGDDFTAAKPFLRPMQELAESYPCPNFYDYGGYHRVVMHNDDDIVAVCEHDPYDCETLHLSKLDITVYELNLPVLYKAIADALALEPAEAEVPYAAKTAQLGFDRQKNPVFLTVQTDPQSYRNTVFAVAAKVNGPLVFIVPTCDICPPDCGETLAARRGRLLYLSDILVVDSSGKMSASPSCADMLDCARHSATAANRPFSYSHGFRCVSVDGTYFTLTSFQAHVIQILYDAHASGIPDVDKDYILDEIGSHSRRIRQVFKRNTEVYDLLVCRGTRRGTYRLKIEP